MNSKPLPIGIDNFEKLVTRDYYFVDKTLLLDDILNAVEIDGQRFLCITRPRRFGKSVMAHMVGVFLGETADSGSTFDHLAAAKSERCKKLILY